MRVSASGDTLFWVLGMQARAHRGKLLSNDERCPVGRQDPVFAVYRPSEYNLCYVWEGYHVNRKSKEL